MILIDKYMVYKTHQSTIENFGGESGYTVNTDSMIESILDQQYAHFGYNKYPDIFLKSAMLMVSFIKNHCFIDGNKRVGISVAILLLRLNGFEDNLDVDETEQKVLEIV